MQSGEPDTHMTNNMYNYLFTNMRT